MEKQYELYCLADPLFYDAPDRGRGRTADFAVAGRRLPQGWRRVEKGEWLIHHPGTPMPEQGWKIHVSACLDNAEEVLAATWDYCVPLQISLVTADGEQGLLSDPAASAGGTLEVAAGAPAGTQVVRIEGTAADGTTYRDSAWLTVVQ